MSPGSPAAIGSARIAWIDVAKALGIATVFYGHLAESFIRLGAPSALEQMKFIYSFHMPLFFLLVGLVYKDSTASLGRFLLRKVQTRLVPVWVFNIVSMLFWIVTEFGRGDCGWIYEHGWSALAPHCAVRNLEMVFLGRYTWNYLTWFLICLFTIEFWQYLLQRLVRRNLYLVISIGVFATLTVFGSLYSDSIDAAVGGRKHSWQITSAIAAMVFYQLGILIRRLGLLSSQPSVARAGGLGVVCVAITLLTFDTNKPSAPGNLPVVFLVNGEYGNVGWFFLTSLVGSLAVIFGAQVFARSSMLNYVGKITLGLMCLDGILHSFVNPNFARFVTKTIPVRSALLFTGICLLVTILSIVVCIPICWYLERRAPFLLGRPARRNASAVTTRPSAPPDELDGQATGRPESK